MPPTMRLESSIFSPEDLRSVVCPDCNAQPGKPCVSLLVKHQELKTLHVARAEAAERSGIQSHMSKWSDILTRQAEESRQRDDDFLAQGKAQLPKMVADLPYLPAEELVSHLVEFSRKGSHDPRITEVWVEYAEACKVEVLRRLESA